MQSARAAARTGVFLLNVFPMLPSGPVNRLTRTPRVEKLYYPTPGGEAVGDLYRPAGRGPFPAVVVCLGVVPFGVDHPQVPRLGAALARAGLVALLYWSPAMRDCRLDPADGEGIALAYERLLAQPCVDPARSGLLGTCVGGAFALLAAAQHAIRDRVAFVFAYAPYASMWTLARDIASASRVRDGVREHWAVDPLTRKVYVRSLTAALEPVEAERLRRWGEESGLVDELSGLSDDGRTVAALLARLEVGEAEAAVQRLPGAMRQRLDAMSPLCVASDLHAPLIVLCHDRDDPVVPVSESRSLASALASRTDVRYTEFTVFKHLDPTRNQVGWPKLAWELLRFCRAAYPVFRQAASQ